MLRKLLPSLGGLASVQIPAWTHRSAIITEEIKHSLQFRLLGFIRGYKSRKKSLKPLNNKANWLAAKPFLPKPSYEVMQARNRVQRYPIVDSCIPAIPTPPQPAVFEVIGRITGEYRLPLRHVFAVMEVQGKQVKVTTDDVIFVDYMPKIAVNDVVSFNRVLLLGSRTQTVVGRPFVPGARVTAAVEEHFRDGKIHVFRFRKRKRSRKYKGHRSPMTTLRILEVHGIDEQPNVPTPPLQLPVALVPAAAAGPDIKWYEQSQLIAAGEMPPIEPPGKQRSVGASIYELERDMPRYQQPTRLVRTRDRLQSGGVRLVPAIGDRKMEVGPLRPVTGRPVEQVPSPKWKSKKLRWLEKRRAALKDAEVPLQLTK